MRRCVTIHLTSNLDKFNFLIMAARKLLPFVSNEILADNSDLPSNHELFTADTTQLISSIFKDRLEDILMKSSMKDENKREL